MGDGVFCGIFKRSLQGCRMDAQPSHASRFFSLQSCWSQKEKFGGLNARLVSKKVSSPGPYREKMILGGPNLCKRA
eukprot:181487-Amphidinium_carterae.1